MRERVKLLKTLFPYLCSLALCGIIKFYLSS